MKATNILLGALAAFGVVATAQAAPTIAWKIADAIAAGTGCSIYQTDMHTRGNILFVNNHDMLINSTNSWAALAERKACTIRIPITVPGGYFIKSARSINTINAYKSASDVFAQAKIMMSLSGTQAEVLNFDAEVGAERRYQINYTDLTASRSDFCQSSHSTDTILGINMAMAISKSSTSDDAYLALGAPGASLEIANFELQACY